MLFCSFKRGKNLKLINKKSVFIDKTVVLGNNVTIFENVRIEGNTTIGDNCVILPNSFIKDCVIGNDCSIDHSHLTESVLQNGCVVGPYARLRPNTKLKNNVRVGNFVEIKNATLGNGTKANHLAYIGDADVGDNCNIGCGVIFVNYNGKTKNRSTIGDNCFIGSNTNVIAPVHVESNVYICAGSNVTKDCKTDDFVIGRTPQQNKPNRANHYLKKDGEN